MPVGVGGGGGGGGSGERKAPTQPLPPKEAAAFRKVVKSYEQKQFRNGLRMANQILKAAAEHGETLSMKGLILNSMGRREEARDCVKRGLKADIHSHVCWHVYGLFHRSEKKYEEAIKAYRNALARDKDNMQILRDLSLLQIQMRDLEGYKDTRYSLLALRPTQRASWIGYAMAYHLLGQYDTALRILAEFIRSQTEAKKANSFQPPAMDFEHSELLLYQNMVLREAGKISEALAHLSEHEFAIVDKTQVLELRGQLYQKDGRALLAAQFYRELLQRNPDNSDYFLALESCMEYGREEAAEARIKFYRDLQGSFPRATVPKLRPLFFLTGQAFAAQLDDFVRAGLRKGQPSLFQLLRALYQSEEKASIIGSVVGKFRAELEGGGGEEEEEAPTTLLWTLYFLAQHHDRLGEWEKALALVDKALNHTPTLIELLTLKAKILKHAGALSAAAAYAEEAQALDTADRFINCKAAKYLLRVGRVEEAEVMAGKFTREGMDPLANLAEMQCMWFETEEAAAFYRLGMLGHALRRCHDIQRHFADMEEDQFDFHTYCVRKMTLCAYVRLLRLEDSLRAHPFYLKAAALATRIYLRLHDAPSEAGKAVGLGGGGGKEGAALSSEERKRERKEKKARAKAEAERAAAKPSHPPQKPQKKNNPDEDSGATQAKPLEPSALLATEKPLDEAVSFLTPLLDLNTPHIDAYILGFHVYWRKEKILRMTQCLRRAHDIEPLHPKLHVCKLQMLIFVEGKSWEGALGQVVQEQLDAIFASQRCPIAFHQSFVAETKDSFPHLLAAVEGGQTLRDYGPAKGKLNGRTAELLKALLSSVNSHGPGQSHLSGLTLPNLLRANKLLKAGRLGPQDPLVLERFQNGAAKLFPLAEAFRSPDDPQPDHPSLQLLPDLLNALKLNSQPPNTTATTAAAATTATANGQANL